MEIGDVRRGPRSLTGDMAALPQPDCPPELEVGGRRGVSIFIAVLVEGLALLVVLVFHEPAVVPHPALDEGLSAPHVSLGSATPHPVSSSAADSPQPGVLLQPLVSAVELVSFDKPAPQLGFMGAAGTEELHPDASVVVFFVEDDCHAVFVSSAALSNVTRLAHPLSVSLLFPLIDRFILLFEGKSE